jgi:hypothetical protein
MVWWDANMDSHVQEAEADVGLFDSIFEWLGPTYLTETVSDPVLPLMSVETVTFTVLDQNHAPWPGVSVLWVADSMGSIGSPWQHCVTDQSGVCVASYPGPPVPYYDRITAFVDADGSGDQSTRELYATSVVSWEGTIDVTAPTVQLVSPADGALFSVGQSVNAAYSCADEPNGSGIQSCTGVVGGGSGGVPVASGDPLYTATAGTFFLHVFARDFANNQTGVDHLYQVLAGNLPPETVTGSPTAPGVVTTDPGGVGATAAVPVQTAVSTPQTATVSIDPTGLSQTAPANYSFLNQQLSISVANPNTGTSIVTSPTSPLRLVFTVDASLLGPQPNGSVINASNLAVFRSDTGSATPILAGDCAQTGVTSPDPCVEQRVDLTNGDARLTVISTHASVWNLASRKPYPFTGFYAPVDNSPVLNKMSAGQAVPVKFGLGGSQGMGIFAAGYPTSQQVTCASGAPVDPVEQTITAGQTSLSYDAATQRYQYIWKTDKAWAAGCRRLTLKLVDGSVHTALFQLTK